MSVRDLRDGVHSDAAGWFAQWFDPDTEETSRWYDGSTTDGGKARCETILRDHPAGPPYIGWTSTKDRPRT